MAKKSNKIISKLENKLKAKQERIQYLESLLAQKDEEIVHSTNQLNRVLETTRWKWMDKLCNIGYKTKVLDLLKILFVSKEDYKTPNQTKKENVENDKYNPYEHLKHLKDIETVVVNKNYALKKSKKPFSFATTIMNEDKSILKYLNSIESQSLKPNEVVIVDGGSTDKTIKYVDSFVKKSSLNIIFVKSQNLNIPAGRSLAVNKASHEIVVLADAGSILSKNYCANLVGCINEHKNADLVGGTYRPINDSTYADYFIPDWNTLEWDIFLPSTRALVIKKPLAIKAGYFPKYLSSGDDTLFDINYRRLSKKWVFNKKVKVRWEGPHNKEQFLKVAHSYGKGDGESGVGDFLYYNHLFNKIESKPKSLFLAKSEMFKGYIEGRGIRANLEISKRKVKKLFLILTDNPISESFRNNSKSYLLAKKYINNNNKVVFVNITPDQTGYDERVFLDIDYTLLELYHANDFNLDELCKRYKDVISKIDVIVDSPHSLFYKMIQETKRKNKDIKIEITHTNSFNLLIGWSMYNLAQYTNQIKSKLVV